MRSTCTTIFFVPIPRAISKIYLQNEAKPPCAKDSRLASEEASNGEIDYYNDTLLFVIIMYTYRRKQIFMCEKENKRQT